MSTNNKTENPVLAVARDFIPTANTPVMLSTGIQAILKPVSATLIDSVTSKIIDPDPPTVYDKDKEREFSNPDDPAYVNQLNANARLRGLAALDAMVMFGVELVDPIPADDQWVKKLRYMEKRGLLDLSEFDLSEAMDREFVYKRLIAVSPKDIDTLNKMNRLGPEVQKVVEDSF